MAKDAGRVADIELAEEAVRNARHNAFMNKLHNCTFRAVDAAEILEELSATRPPWHVIWRRCTTSVSRHS